MGANVTIRRRHLQKRLHCLKAHQRKKKSWRVWGKERERKRGRWIKINKKTSSLSFLLLFLLFTITLLSSLYNIDVLFFLAVLKINLLAHFLTFLKNYKSHQNFEVWSPDLYKVSIQIGSTQIKSYKSGLL